GSWALREEEDNNDNDDGMEGAEEQRQEEMPETPRQRSDSFSRVHLRRGRERNGAINEDSSSVDGGGGGGGDSASLMIGIGGGVPHEFLLPARAVRTRSASASGRSRGLGGSGTHSVRPESSRRRKWC
ncbi:unnamed protein product, partial [Laminaria digitata]